MNLLVHSTSELSAMNNVVAASQPLESVWLNVLWQAWPWRAHRSLWDWPNKTVTKWHHRGGTTTRGTLRHTNKCYTPHRTTPHRTSPPSGSLPNPRSGGVFPRGRVRKHCTQGNEAEGFFFFFDFFPYFLFRNLCLLFVSTFVFSLRTCS